MPIATLRVPEHENALDVRIVQLPPRGKPLPLPAYQTLLSVGMDLHADIAAPVTLAPLERRVIPTGIAIQLPRGYEAQVRPRSGISSRHGITLINSPGTIDGDYVGECHVPVVNISTDPYTIEPGERIAQMIVAPVMRVRWVRVDALEPTARGAGGFGHTGR